MPTVTQILGVFADFAGIPEDVLAHAAARGTRVHAACAAHARGLWAGIYEKEDQGYISSFRRWFDVTVEDVALVECELVDEALGFKGHPDLICRLRGDKALTVVDLKTPAAKAKTWIAQLAAYRHLAEINNIVPVERAATVRLQADGAPAIFDRYTKAEIMQGLSAFMGALNAYRFFKGEE